MTASARDAAPASVPCSESDPTGVANAFRNGNGLPATPPSPVMAHDRAGALERLLGPYAEVRKLSRRQHWVFRLYLEGKADKEIAHILGCAAATVYEHWRRMARKAGGRNKSDAISDFHHFLGDRIA